MKVTYINLQKEKNNENKREKKTAKRYKENKKINLEQAIKNKFYNISKNKENSKNNKQKKISKISINKNQISLFAISLMLVTAGYMNYINNVKKNLAEIGDAQLVSANIERSKDFSDETEENIAEFEIEDDNLIEETSENINEKNIEKEETNIAQNENTEDENIIEKTQETSNNLIKSDDDYFAKTKLERNTMYSQMIETYEKILENDKIQNDQKSIAANEIKNINDRRNKIATLENLIQAKGIEDVVTLINDNSINIVIKSNNNEEIEQDKIAQIQNIVSRELNTDIENIHITTHI